MKRILVLVVIGLLLSQAHHLFGQISYPDPAVIQDLFNRLNTLRARRGLPADIMNPALTLAAQNQADWLVATGMRTHFRPDGSRPSTRALAAGYVTQDWCCGENYYMSIDATPDMVWNFWLWSSHHYLNLVNPRFDEVGFGMATNGRRYSYVMVFGNAPDPFAPPPTPTAIPVTSANVVTGDYMIQRGDTLMSIAQRFGVSMDALAAANRVVNPALIYPGQQLIIPGGASTANVVVTPQIPATTVPAITIQQPVPIAAPPVAGQQTHIVQPGENLFRIALRYGVSVQAIMAANGMSDSNMVYAGQQLVIPAGGAPATSGNTIQTAITGGCSGFQATSPLDGYHNGATTFYWNPAPGGVSGYRVEVYGANNQFLTSFEVDGGSTSLTGDMSANHIGSGLTFSWQVIALSNAQAVCTSQRVTAMRENSAP